MEGVADFGPDPFLIKLYDVVDDPNTDNIISWGSAGQSFLIRDHGAFIKEIIPHYFKDVFSFVDQLLNYFRPVDFYILHGSEFANEGFQRGQRQLLKTIKRQRSPSSPSSSQQGQASSAACPEAGLDSEVHQLQRDKGTPLAEVAKQQDPIPSFSPHAERRVDMPRSVANGSLSLVLAPMENLESRGSSPSLGSGQDPQMRRSMTMPDTHTHGLSGGRHHHPERTRESATTATAAFGIGIGGARATTTAAFGIGIGRARATTTVAFGIGIGRARATTTAAFGSGIGGARAITTGTVIGGARATTIAASDTRIGGARATTTGTVIGGARATTTGTVIGGARATTTGTVIGGARATTTGTSDTGIGGVRATTTASGTGIGGVRAVRETEAQRRVGFSSATPDLEAGGGAPGHDPTPQLPEEEARTLKTSLIQIYAALLASSFMSYSLLKDAPKHVKIITFGGQVVIIAILFFAILSRSLARRRFAFWLVSFSAVALLTLSVASQL